MQSPLDPTQVASAEQFDRQADNYGRGHILADTADVADALSGIELPAGAAALDVATGGGHTALHLARRDLRVTIGDVSARMLKNARALLAEEGFDCVAHRFPAERMPFADKSFDLVTTRVAPHHFSSPVEFVAEAARVLKPGGWLMVIDGSVPDDSPTAAAWIDQVERWRDPSHVHLMSRAEWREIVGRAGLSVERCELSPLVQPDLDWYLEVAGTAVENRQQIREAIETATDEVREAMALGVDEAGKVTWRWQRVTLLARRA